MGEPPFAPLPRGNCAGRTAVRPYAPLHAEIVQGEPPFAPTPRSRAENVQGERRSPLHPHSVGEGLGVRANTSERQHRDRLGDQRKRNPEHAD
jgi:hypothetical protein